jgi:hypothetical protein
MAVSSSSKSLQAEIERWSKEIHTDGYPMSIGELINLYENNELDIHPEFQRFYRWTLLQKSRLIESLLLGIPIPSVFVAQRDDGVWDVIDGLQRLSTIFQFVGILRDDSNNTVEPLWLVKTTYLPSLDGKYWETGVGDSSLTQPQRLFIKRAKLDVKIIKKESDPQSKYELFMRVNTGGTSLTDQEVRSCVLVMENKDVFLALKEMGDNEHFRSCIALSDRLIDQQYHLELVARFIVLRKIKPSAINIENLGEFLTDKMKEIAHQGLAAISEHKDSFFSTFSMLSEAIASDAFRKYDKKRKRHSGPFLISAYEAIALGIGYNYKQIEAARSQNNNYDVVAKIKELWASDGFINNIGSGISGTTRMRTTLDFGRKHFKP